MDSGKLPSKEDYRQVRKLMHEWMPNYANLLEDLVTIMIEEEQDILIIFFGPPGRGKSNLAFLTNVFIADVLDRKFKLKNRFSLKFTEWKGLEYLSLFEEPAQEYVDRMKLQYDETVVNKWKGTIFWLDEAADINALENTNTFNREMNKHMATLRAMQLIYVWNIDNPMKLLPDIRTYRVTMGNYIFITPEKRKFEGIGIKNVRANAIYGRNEWIKIAAAPPEVVRVGLVKTQEFLDKFRPWKVEPIPPYPRTPFLTEYKRLKALKMGERALESIKKVKEKMQEKAIEHAENFGGLPSGKIKMLKELGFI